MKKVLTVIAVILVLAVLAGGGLVWAVLNSPHYAMAQIAQDIQNEGLDGLEPHLTGDARETLDKLEDTVDKITSLPEKLSEEHKILGLILSATDAEGYVEDYVNNYIDELKSKAEEMQWSLGDVLTNFKKAVVTLNFNYDDEITGSIDLKMVRTDGEWKINGIGLPHFDEFEWS